MPKFKVGDQVVLPSDKLIVPQAFSGRTGTVTEVYAEIQVQSTPRDRLAPTYMVRFDGEDDAMLIGEDWLELS